MPTLNLSIASGSDDAHGLSTTFTTNASSFNLGNTVGPLFGKTIDRFTGASAIVGKTITQALFRVQCGTTDAGESVNYTVTVENADSPTMPTTVADMDGRTKTSGTAWNISTPGSIQYLEIDIKNEIQVLADRPGFTGNINVFLYDSSTASGQRVLRYFYEFTGNPGAQLNITYSSGPTFDFRQFNPFKSFIKGY